MKFREFLRQLSEEEFVDYAKRAGVSPRHLNTHLSHAYKEPRKRLRRALADQSNGKVSHMEILEHFGYLDP